MLEILVHLNAANLPDDRYLIEIEIPDNLKIKYLTKRNLPDGWHVHHVLPDTQKLGDDFIADRSAPVLKVPSAIVPHEYNYLINPNHPDSRRIKIRQKHRLVLDPRLLNMFK
jgi:RES domain-containing protein